LDALRWSWGKMDTQDSDGLPVNVAGSWTIAKHKLLRDYVIASRGARRRFQGNSSFIDLFSGPGRTRIKDTGSIVDGSPLVAYNAAQVSGDQFGTYHFSDVRNDYLEAAALRVARQGGVVKAYPGPALETVKQITRDLNNTGLHFAFLDPYGLTDLPFSILRELSRFQRMDMLVHVSVMHWKRELPKWLSNDGPCVLDNFMPGWRQNIDVYRRQDNIRAQLFDYWRSLIISLNMTAADDVKAIDNSKDVDIYWLVLVSRHDLAEKLWSSIATAGRQGSLF
jgi:three-Cys-motif partner protein